MKNQYSVERVILISSVTILLSTLKQKKKKKKKQKKKKKKKKKKQSVFGKTTRQTFQKFTKDRNNLTIDIKTTSLSRLFFD